MRKVFELLGVDVSDPKQVEEFRRDLRFGGTMRRAADRGLGTAVTIIATGVLAALWLGLQAKVTGNG
ncbi:unnamed protein product [Pararhodospirillum photometricum DSM 122]|uniref:Uncharacterized protein n=1 Tax=Pararhodospirillum photometricum DSM 122 TaxID=1150469 RepID=H6SQI3_PARPM|nr:unnamed protein product [Pararhodospirillum photometricum DSM 122]